MQTTFLVLWHTLGMPTHDEQLILRVQPTAVVMRGARLRMMNGGTQAYELVSIGGAVPPIHEYISQDISDCARSHAAVLGQATETASHVPADRIVASALKVDPGTSVLRLERVVRIRGGSPVEWRIAFVYIPG